MVGETDLDKMLALLQPVLSDEEFVFCSVPTVPLSEIEHLQPRAVYQEEEGLSLLLSKEVADAAGIKYAFVARCITLSVHSSLEAVGFTAAVSSKLAKHGISANVIAGFYHDHVYVPADQATVALKLLTEFERRPL